MLSDANTVTLLAGGPNLLAWLVLGGLAGWLTGNLMRGKGYGCLGNIILGCLGAFLGGALMSYFTSGAYGFIASLIIAVIGSVLVVALARLIFGHRAPASAD